MSPSADLTDDFDGPGLDTEVWVPHYLPQWSSRAQSAATYDVADSELRLTIPPEQGLWCAGDHEPPLRASGSSRRPTMPRCSRSTAFGGARPANAR
jgi:hypothetical protein